MSDNRLRESGGTLLPGETIESVLRAIKLQNDSVEATQKSIERKLARLHHRARELLRIELIKYLPPSCTVTDSEPDRMRMHPVPVQKDLHARFAVEGSHGVVFDQTFHCSDFHTRTGLTMLDRDTDRMHDGERVKIDVLISATREQMLELERKERDTVDIDRASSIDADPDANGS